MELVLKTLEHLLARLSALIDLIWFHLEGSLLSREPLCVLVDDLVQQRCLRLVLMPNEVLACIALLPCTRVLRYKVLVLLLLHLVEHL